MKKGSESPLQQQANKRFLGQITGLKADEQVQGNDSPSGLQRIINKLKAIF